MGGSEAFSSLSDVSQRRAAFLPEEGDQIFAASLVELLSEEQINITLWITSDLGQFYPALKAVC